MFPKVQFFAATHSPLVARSFRPFSDDGPHHHYHLKNSETNDRVEAVEVIPLGGKRTDQILASQAFDFLIDDDPDAEQILRELSFLAGVESLTAQQMEQIEYFLDKVKEIDAIRLGQTKTEYSAAMLAELTQISLNEDAEQEQ